MAGGSSAIAGSSASQQASDIPAKPPSTQFHSGVSHVVSKYSQLTPEQKTLCDGLIISLGLHNLSSDQPTDATRRALWKAVFSNWDTTCPIVKPKVAPRVRTHHDAATECGTITQNLPGKASPARVANQPAFIKPNVNWDGDGVVFNWVDGRGSGVSSKYVRLKDGYSLQQARALASNHWDRSEAARLGAYNLSQAVFWARHRLCQSIAQGVHSATATATTVGSRPTDKQPTPVYENHALLQQVAQIRLIIPRMEGVLRDMVAMSPQGQAKHFVTLQPEPVDD